MRVKRARSRAERKATTRTSILEAARRQLIDRGYEGTTIRDVAAAAEVAVGSVHVHFRDKRALLFACFYSEIAAAVARIWETLPDSTLLDQLTHCGEVLYAAYAEHPELSRVMFREALFPAADAERDASFEPFMLRIAELFVQAQQRGELRQLPEAGRRAAQNFFAAYLLVLIGGLSGELGPFTEGATMAKAWAKRLRALLQLQLVGLGASDEG